MPPPVLTAAMMSIAGPKPPLMPAAPLTPAAAGTAATPISCAARARVLLTPDAMPACRSGAEPSAVAVSGATAVDSPRPTTSTPGSTPVR